MSVEASELLALAGIPTTIAFEDFYSDASGVQFAVRFAGDEIEFEAVERIQFPRDRIDWLIHCLTYIKGAIEPPAASLSPTNGQDTNNDQRA